MRDISDGELDILAFYVCDESDTADTDFRHELISNASDEVPWSLAIVVKVTPIIPNMYISTIVEKPGRVDRLLAKAIPSKTLLRRVLDSFCRGECPVAQAPSYSLYTCTDTLCSL